jgi:CrcB protein
MALALTVGVAGAIGAVARYLLDGAVQDRTSGPFPLGTLTVNVAGSLVLGLLAGIALHHASAATTKAIIGTGFCGGLTTWSAASWEAVRLVEEGSPRTAAAYTVVNLCASLAAGAVGLVVMTH